MSTAPVVETAAAAVADAEAKRQNAAPHCSAPALSSKRREASIASIRLDSLRAELSAVQSESAALKLSIADDRKERAAAVAVAAAAAGPTTAIFVQTDGMSMRVTGDLHELKAITAHRAVADAQLTEHSPQGCYFELTPAISGFPTLFKAGFRAPPGFAGNISHAMLWTRSGRMGCEWARVWLMG
jgi:hypothetical protein